MSDMKKIKIETRSKKMLADVYTPVGIYLRLRDRFRDAILLESTDHHAAENSYSFICIQAIAGIEISSSERMEFKLPLLKPEQVKISRDSLVGDLFSGFMDRIEFSSSEEKATLFAQGLYGYTSYDAVQLFESIRFAGATTEESSIPLMRYRLYQYVIAVNHFKDEIHILENQIPGLESESAVVESLIRSRDVPEFPFSRKGTESSNMSDAEYVSMVKEGIRHCHRGDVFQIVLSRSYSQQFTGDDFNVYRALRSINPSPYLFYFDYGDYRLMGSSPEAQIRIQNGRAVVHPIAGTFTRTGDDDTDQKAAAALLKDPKENAEHVMLVDLARNDLSRVCDDVQVTHFKEIQYYSHVIHLVSEVSGLLKEGRSSMELMAGTFPAGTLSGAPKFRAMELISELEPERRGYYGGAIGFIGFNGNCNKAIMIRTFLSRNNTLRFRAGAGVVVASNPEHELNEVNNKLGALKKAIRLAEEIT